MEMIKRYIFEITNYGDELMCSHDGDNWEDVDIFKDDFCKSADVTALQQRCEELEAANSRLIDRTAVLETAVKHVEYTAAHQIAALQSRLEDAEKLARWFDENIADWSDVEDYYDTADLAAKILNDKPDGRGRG
jgi:hypothetical protein